MAKKRSRKAAREGSAPRGLAVSEIQRALPRELTTLSGQVERDGGTVLAAYREPVGGKGLLLVALPVERVAPTPFQRELSAPHVKRLAAVIDKVGRFLDPIVVVRNAEGSYWTPNGNHRLHALRELGVQAVTALLVPEPEVAYQILALNTERAHNLREKSLEAYHMEQALAGDPDRSEVDFAFEFEEPAFLTLGAAYEQHGRLAGSSYKPVVGRLDAFRGEPLARALRYRERVGGQVVALDRAVNEIVAALKARGLTSPYLKTLVVARLNPLRFKKSAQGDLEEVLGTMREKAGKFDPSRIKPEDLQSAAGPPGEE